MLRRQLCECVCVCVSSIKRKPWSDLIWSDRNDLKVATVVVAYSTLCRSTLIINFGFKVSSVRSTVIISPCWHRGTYGCMCILHSDVVHGCTAGNYCMRIKNNAGTRRVSQNIIPCVKFTAHLHDALSKWEREMVFISVTPRRLQLLAHSVTSSTATLPSASTCISSECIFYQMRQKVILKFFAVFSATSCNFSVKFLHIYVTIVYN